MNGPAAPQRLPYLPGPPFEPASLLLDGRTGWRAVFEQVEPDPGDGALALAPAPGRRRTLAEPSGSFGGLVPPGGVAVGPGGDVYLLDTGALVLKRFDPCLCRFDPVPCLGGEGEGARQWRAPHGIAICGGTLLVCDAGTTTSPGRVGMFALPGFALRGHLAPPRARHTHWEPWAAACDSTRRIYVTDRANGLVHRFGARGHWEAALPGFPGATWIALDRHDRLYVLVQEGEEARVVDGAGLPLPAGAAPARLSPSFAPLPMRVDAAGNLALGAACAGEREAWFDGSGTSLAAPPPSPGPAYTVAGSVLAGPLDSGFDRCQWHRIVLHAQVPEDARIEVHSASANEVVPLDQLETLAGWDPAAVARGPVASDWDCLVRSPPGRYLWLRLGFAGTGAATPRLHAIEAEFPRIGSLRYLPAVFSAEPGGADFSARFLALFDTTLRGIERAVDTQARLFDASSAPAAAGDGPDFLSWLASWIGVSFDRHWDVPKRRRFLKAAGRLFERRGTVAGLHEQLLVLLDFDRHSPCPSDAHARASCRVAPANCAPAPTPVPWRPPPLILEHFRLRRWLHVGAGRLGEQAMLWGERIANGTRLGGARLDRARLTATADPRLDPAGFYASQFTVFVPARIGATEAGRRVLVQLLRAESPAAVRFHIHYVEPRFRIGVQSTIGFDAVVGCPPRGLPLGAGALGQGTILGPGAGSGIDRAARIGSTSRLG